MATATAVAAEPEQDDLATVGRDLRAKAEELAALQTRLAAAEQEADRLQKDVAAAEIAFAEGADNAAARLTELRAALDLALGKQRGIERLIGNLEPAIEQLRAAWSRLKRADDQRELQAAIDKLSVEINSIDEEIRKLSAQIDIHNARRIRIFDERVRLQHQRIS